MLGGASGGDCLVVACLGTDFDATPTHPASWSARDLPQAPQRQPDAVDRTPSHGVRMIFYEHSFVQLYWSCLYVPIVAGKEAQSIPLLLGC